MRTVLAFLLPLSLCGCQVLQDLAAQLEKPTAQITGVNLADLGTESLTLAFDVRVNNPYSVSLPVDKLGYSLATADTPFVTGETSPGVEIAANGFSDLELPLTVSYSELLNLVTSVRPGSVVPYKAALDVGVNAPGLGLLNLPLKKEGELPVPVPPTVEVTSIDWTSLSFQQAAANLNLKVGNLNEFAFALKNMDYDLKLAGQPIASAALASAADFSAGGESNVTIPISFSPSSLGVAAFNMLTGEGSSYDLSGEMDIETPFGPLSYPFAKIGETIFNR